VQVGRSRFCRCRHLIVDLQFHLNDGTWARRLTQSPELGFGFCLFFFWNGFAFVLLLYYAVAATVIRLRLPTDQASRQRDARKAAQTAGGSRISWTPKKTHPQWGGLSMTPNAQEGD